MRTTYPTLITAATLALLSACATNTAPQANATNAQTESATAATTPEAPAATTAPEPFKEGNVAEFGKTATKLDNAAIANISKPIEAFKQAKSIEVTGYCDRKDNAAGAQKLALARAGAVQAELIKQARVRHQIANFRDFRWPVPMESTT